MLKIFFSQVFWIVALLSFSSLTGNTSKYLSVSHTEGKGLGYCEGYSSLDLFVAQPICNRYVPFVDLRGHLFNDGIKAGNAGIGLRYVNSPCDIWGINFYYDSYMVKRRVPYHQISFGFETLSDTWETHVNGYLPVGRKSTPIYSIQYDFTSGFLAKVRQQFAMAGADAEIGYHFCNFYAGIGSYVYRGRGQETENAFLPITKHLVGGRLRAKANFLRYCSLECLATYDARFSWGGQATFAINIPLGWACWFTKEPKICNPCRLYQPVIRNEIIVVDKINRFSTDPSILNPENVP